MEKFIVSARKYRPDNFLSLVGQDSIATTLKNSIRRDQLAHAYLFCGPRGVGKTSTARIFAKTINCMNPSADLEPCGECESCKSFAKGLSYSIHELDAASNNSVEDIRLLTEKVRIPPQTGKYSVYIIDEVHMLSSAAFNAFLKTLEEPPAHAIFILATTEKHKILPTILSRCQTYDFNRISVEDIVKNLKEIAVKEGVTIDSDSLHVIAQKADGAMRDALTLFDQTVAFCGTNVEYASVIRNLNVLDHDYYFNLIECALSGNFAKAMLLFDEILSKGFNALYFIGGLSSHLRNLLVCKDSSTLKLLEMSPALMEKYMSQSGRCPFKFLYDALGATTKCESDYRSSNNQRLLVEFMLIKLSQLVKPAEQLSGLQMQTAQQQVEEQKVKPVLKPEEPKAEPVSRAEEQKTQPVPQQSEPLQQPVRAEMKQPKHPDQAGVATQEVQQNRPLQQSAGAKSSGLSIKGILKKAQANSAANVESVAETEDVAITEEALNAAWLKMGDSQTAYPRLGSAIKQSKPELAEDGHTVVFYVSNSAQQVWIEKNSLLSLTGFLQKELRNKSVKLVIKVKAVAPQEKKLYMPQEKAEFLMKNYPQMRELQQDLDLDIK